MAWRGDARRRMPAGTCSVIAGTAFALTASPAIAQQQSPATTQPDNTAPAGENEAQTADIVVTAQFRSQRLQDTPISITAVNSEMLDARGQISISQVAAQSPNVNLQEAPATYGPSIQAFIRGVGQSDSVIALEPGVGIYVDDVYYSTLLGSALDLLDLDRVEILRGPQGTLAGQNSIGGAVKLYSKKPSASDGGFAQVTYGSYNRTEFKGAAGFAIVPDKLFARISGAGVQKDGYVTRYDYRCTHPASPVRGFQVDDSCKLGTEGGKSYAAVRGSLRWTPSPGAEFILIGDYTRDNSEASPSTLLYVGSLTAPGSPATPAYTLDGVRYGTATGSPFISYSPFGNFAQDTFSSSPYISYENYINSVPRDGTAPYQARDKNLLNGWGVSGQANFDLGSNFALTSITAYRDYEAIYTSADSSPLNVVLTANHNTSWQFSQELRLSGKLGDLVDFTVGGYYLKARQVAGSRVQLPTLEFSQVDRVHKLTKALFINAELHLTDALNLIGGVRYTDMTNDLFYGRLGNPGSIYGGIAPPSLAPLNGLSVPFSDKRFDYRAAVQYRFTPSLMAYAQFSTGFRSGGGNPRPFFPNQAIDHGPETLQAYEIGLKSDFFDRRIRINASAFFNKYEDILVSVNQCPGLPAAPCALPVNAGRADVKGFEIEANLRPVDGLLIDASAGYLDFDYKSLSPLALLAGLTLDQDGPFVQPWRWSVGTQYEINLGSAGTLTPRLDTNYQGRYFASAVNRPPFNLITARTLLNARITYKPATSQWQAALEVSNLADKLYYDGVFDNRASSSLVQGRPGRPREWAVTFKRNF